MFDYPSLDRIPSKDKTDYSPEINLPQKKKKILKDIFKGIEFGNRLVKFKVNFKTLLVKIK